VVALVVVVLDKAVNDHPNGPPFLHPKGTPLLSA
jgi:hypothetical protein